MSVDEIVKLGISLVLLFFFFFAVTGGARSHLAAIHYFAQSILIKNAFKAIRCSSWNEFQVRNCGDSANTTHMGEHVDQMYVNLGLNCREQVYSQVKDDFFRFRHTGSYYLTVVEPYI